MSNLRSNVDALITMMVKTPTRVDDEDEDGDDDGDATHGICCLLF
jgi:hypothetical protein